MTINRSGGTTMSKKTMLPSACLLISVFALAGPGMIGPASAQTAYDGNWSVAIATRGGACPPSVRYGVQIWNGQVVNPTGGAADVQGRVGPRGAVRVTVRAGGEWAVGSGRLGLVSGGGVWRGQGSGGFCDGTWTAQRRGPAQAAQASGGPIYNYAPPPGARTQTARNADAAACEARFRSYDPATGTYLGIDGARHRCP
jgi:hypothetical protein